jgi:hypothetical protein
MTVNEVRQVLLEEAPLRKLNSVRLAKKLGIPVELVLEARGKPAPLQEKLDYLNLPLSAVDKVKFWDQGENQRFTITTKRSWHETLGLTSINDALESIKTAFKDKISPVRIKVEEKDNRKALFIYLADLHIGAKTSNNSLFPNHYDANVFKERLQHTLVTIKQNKEFFGVFDALYIVNLGDALDGYNKQTTRGGHILPQNLDNNEQLDTFFEAHKDLFDSIVHMEAAKRIEYVACTNSNHDGGGFSYAANRLLDIYLSLKYPDIKRTIITKFIDHLQYGQHTFMFTHGKDDKDMKFGLPATLNEKTENYINAYIHYHKIQTPAIHLVKGDLHLSSKQSGKIFRYKNVLSLYGSSKWVQTNFMVNKCGYNYEIVDKYSTSIYENEHIF